MAIERTEPMRIHKNILIKHLRRYPEDVKLMFPGTAYTAQEVIDYLESRSGQWIVDGRLEGSE